MPSHEGSAWHCEKCGLYGFTTYDLALAHEAKCDPSNARKRQRNHSLVEDDLSLNFGKTSTNSFPLDRALGHLKNDRRKECMISTLPNRLSSFLDSFPVLLAQRDIITCQNIEIFLATPEFVASCCKNEANIAEGQVGLRCIHCYGANTRFILSCGSNFPLTIGKMVNSIRAFAKVHFPRCPMLPSSSLPTVTSSSRSNSFADRTSVWLEEENLCNLIDFCNFICKVLNITSRDSFMSGLFIGVSLEKSDASNFDDSIIDPITKKVKVEDTDTKPAFFGITFDSTKEHERSDITYQSPLTLPISVSQDDTDIFRTIAVMNPDSTAELSNSSRPGDGNFPYYQDVYGFWVCRFCSYVPYHDRAIGSVWQAWNPPDSSFINSHLARCYSYLTLSPRCHLDNAALCSDTSASISDQCLRKKAPNCHVDAILTLNATISNQKLNKALLTEYTHPHSDTINQLPEDHSSKSDKIDLERKNDTIRPTSSMTFIRPNTLDGDILNHSELSKEETIHMHIKDDKVIRNPTSPVVDPNDAVVSALNYLSLSEEKKFKELFATTGERILPLVFEEDRALLSDYIFHLMKQLRMCTLAETDRTGRGCNRARLDIGFAGLQCVHCKSKPRKFFWTDVSRFNNSFSEILGHVMKCCPIDVKESLLVLKMTHADQMSYLPRGSQKQFFLKLWSRLHEGSESNTSDTDIPLQLKLSEQVYDDKVSHHSDEDDSDTAIRDRQNDNDDEHGESTSPSDSEDDLFIFSSTTSVKKAYLALSSEVDLASPVLLALDEDILFLDDFDCFIRNSLEVFCATDHDIQIAQRDGIYPLDIGQIGIRCIHCSKATGAEGARGDAISFPYSVSCIFDSARAVASNHLVKCPNLAKVTRDSFLSISSFTTSSLNMARTYYTSAGKALGLMNTERGVFSSKSVKSCLKLFSK